MDLMAKTIRIMNLTALLLLAAFLQVSARGYAQTPITLAVKNAPLQKVMEARHSLSLMRTPYPQNLVSGINSVSTARFPVPATSS